MKAKNNPKKTQPFFNSFEKPKESQNKATGYLGERIRSSERKRRFVLIKTVFRKNPD